MTGWRLQLSKFLLRELGTLRRPRAILAGVRDKKKRRSGGVVTRDSILLMMMMMRVQYRGRIFSTRQTVFRVEKNEQKSGKRVNRCEQGRFNSSTDECPGAAGQG